jgi:hypothetical protein
LEGEGGCPVLQPAGDGGAVDQGRQERTRLSCHDFIDNQFRLQLFALAYNLGNFFRQIVLPESIRNWTLRTLREKIIKIGAKVVSHARYTLFQMAEVAVSKELLAAILGKIERLSGLASSTA